MTTETPQSASSSSRSTCSRVSKSPICREEHQFLENSKGTYYTSLELPVVGRNRYDAVPKCKTWTLSIGDTIAVACRESTVPNILQRNKKKKWYPFKQKWAPAHVLALYTDAEGKFRMKFRWYYWHKDLNAAQKRALTKLTGKHDPANQVYEHYSTDDFDVCSALGRLCLSPESTRNVLGRDGMPRVFVTCRYAILGERKVEEITDWEHEDALIRALPLLQDSILEQVTRAALAEQSMCGELTSMDSRGDADATCEDSSTNEAFDEQSTYGDSASVDSVGDAGEACGDSSTNGALDEQSTAYEESASIDSRGDADTTSGDSSVESCSQELPSQTESLASEVKTTSSSASSVVSYAKEDSFYNDGENSYYWNVQVPIVPRYYAKKKVLQQHWMLQVGDLIAVRSEQSSKPCKKKPWYPFTTPWSSAQVLGLSRDSSGRYKVLVRWLVRSEEFDLKHATDEMHARLQEDKAAEFASRLVYEYDLVDKVDVETVLGRIALTSEPSPSTQFLNEFQHEDGVPQAPLICQWMVPEGYDWIEAAGDWDGTCTSGLQQLERGLLCLTDHALRKASMERMGDLSMKNNTEAMDDESSFENATQQTVSVITSASDTLSSANDENDNRMKWNASADTPVDDNPASLPLRARNARKRPAAEPPSQAHCEKSARPTKAMEKADTLQQEKGGSHEQCIPSPLPVSIATSPSNTQTVVDNENEFPLSENAPVDTRIEESTASCQLRPRKARKRPAAKPPCQSQRRKSVRVAKSANEKVETLKKAKAGKPKQRIPARSPSSVESSISSSSQAGLSENRSPGRARVFTLKGLLPYHEDLSALRSYYSEVNVLPPFENYADDCQPDQQTKDKREPWTVKMGDTVAVHYKYGAGGTNYGERTGKPRSVNHPFDVDWAVAEVLTIWKNHDSKNEMTKFSKKSQLENEEDITLEIRWLWRKNELPGRDKSAKNADNAIEDAEYEEVFETDSIDECEATSLLAPAKLHATPKKGLSTTQQGMPVIGMYCRRFWSIHRRSLMPCGGLDGRKERGRMHSRYLGKDGVLLAALKKFEGSMQRQQGVPRPVDAVHQPEGWKREFTNAIKKLGLVEASEDARIRGVHLIGRDKEQERIMTFLRSTICGETNEAGEIESVTKSSLFLAGPPGTGKTACVHSVIARLRKEQAKGKLPEFDFVSLNGMEMRHPFEAYVKFWEAISGPEKEKRPAEVAVALLERHFGGRRRNDDESVKGRPVVVLLLDEIDYLVTKKQSVLYNFFDWPRRACDNGNGPRLVVIGISNTLNLPTRLKPSVQSRLGSERCDFRSYNAEDMITILKSKVQPQNKVSLVVPSMGTHLRIIILSLTCSQIVVAERLYGV